jgi:signal transduction histidine kinase
MLRMQHNLARRILVTVGALVLPALAMVGYLATEVSRREFARVLIEPADMAWREQQATQLADVISSALDASNATGAREVEAALARSAGALGRGVVVLVTGVDGSFVAAHPHSVRIASHASDGVLVVEGTANPGGREWRLHVPANGGAVVRGRSGHATARVYVLEDPDVRVRREANFIASVRDGVIVVVLLAGMLSLVIAASLAKRIVRPVEELSSLAIRFGAGDLTARSLAAIGSDEIGHLARSFNEMADRLAEADQVRRTMLTDIAHELRTPLTNVRCQLEAVQDGLLPATAETIGSLNEEIHSLMRAIDDLQDLALAEAGRLRLDMAPCDIEVELRSLVRASERPEGPLITVHTSSSLVARVDPKRFRQIVRNLIANAIAAVPPDGHVAVSAEPAGESVEIRVTDDGPGVPAAYLSRVFDRYYRVDGGGGRSGGTGLGLAIVKRLVELHGGTVTAGRRPEGGMVFSLTLPRVPS